MGPTFIAITIYIGLIAYALAVVNWVSGRRGDGYRNLWTVGCLFLWAHTICAFHFHHHWSHADAVQLTAEQTQQVMGFAYGNGIWFSYLLLMVWLFDVVQLWRQKSASATRWYYLSYAVHAYAFFILFNGTVVFEEGVVRWGGVIGTLWIVRMAWRYRKAPISAARPSGLRVKG